ncbi:putative HNHc nuclease [Fusobacterium polymorphum]|uniref:putative HNHc nuclease n=1 Tax=Fusobacterium nucleatum subsp. polymorphum TaxID=76857 RepID=UPI00300B8FA8
MEKLGYTRQTQKLIYWLLDDFANFWQGNEAGARPSFIELAYTKEVMKAKFVKVYDGFDTVKNAQTFLISSIMNKDNLTVDELTDNVIKALQSLAIQNGGFSLSLNSLTQKQANDFVKWLFEMAIYWEIPLRQEIRDLFAEDYQNAFIYATLKKKICCICGKEHGVLHHYDNVARIGGYKFDDGRVLRVMCLCEEHHTEVHAIGAKNFSSKYHVVGIYLDDRQIRELKKVYKGHFQAFKEEE